MDTKNKIIDACGFSEEMKKYLKTQDLSAYDLTCIIAGAVINLEKKMELIHNVMDNTIPSDDLNELCDTLFPEDFQRMLDEFRPETREQVERERNRLRYEVGLLTDQLSAMANRLKEALENSVPIPEIEKQLLRLSPGTALDLCGKMTLMLSDNQAWMASMLGKVVSRAAIWENGQFRQVPS